MKNCANFSKSIRLLYSLDISVYKTNPFKYFEEVKDDPKSYQTAIEICKLIQDPVDSSLCALKYFHRLAAKPFEIPSNTWETIINLFSRNRFYEQIYEIYEIMRVKNPSYGNFSAETWVNLLHGCAKVGRSNEIRDIVEHMKKYKVDVTLSMYHSILELHIQKKDVLSAVQLLDTMGEMEVTSTTLKLFLELCLAAKDQRFDVIYHGFKERGVNVDENDTKRLYLMCWTTISLDIPRALEFISTMATREEDYQLIMSACKEKEDSKMALVIYKKIQEEFKNPRIETQNLLLEVFSVCRDDRILGLFDEWRARATSTTYHAVLKYYAMIGDVNKNAELIKEMKSRDITTTVETVNIMTGAFFRNKWKGRMGGAKRK